MRLEDITTGLREDIFGRSLAIDTDVDLGATNVDERRATVDKRNIGKIGYGMFISGTDGFWEGDQQSPYIMDRIMSIFERDGIIMQTVGSPLPPDRGEVPSINEFMVQRGIAVINAGILVGSMHSPEEIIDEGDLFHCINGYRRFIEDSKPTKSYESGTS